MSNSANKLTFNPTTGQLDVVNVFSPPNGSATLVTGTVTVSTPYITANSEVFLTGQDGSGSPGELSITNRVAGVSFDILSTSNMDTRKVAWLLYEPATSTTHIGPWMGLAFTNFDT
jgi:hypothetical protein